MTLGADGPATDNERAGLGPTRESQRREHRSADGSSERSDNSGDSRGPTTTNRYKLTSIRLARLIETELKRQGLNCEQAARDARLPADAFRSVFYGRKPNIDRADELCRALGITMTIGASRDRNPEPPDQP